MAPTKKPIRNRCVREYIDYLEDHGRRPTTLRNYALILDHLIDVLREGGHHTDPREIDADDIAYLCANLGTLKESSVKMNLRMLSNMVYHYSGRDPERDADILWNSGQDDVHRVYITKDEWARLYGAADPTDRLVLVFGAFMGLRRAEIAAIRDSEISGDRVIIHGKGHGPHGKVAVLAMPEPVLREIAAYRAWKGDRPRADDYLLQGSGFGDPVLSGYDARTLTNRMNRLGRRTGITVSPHALRRLYATTLYYDCDAKVETIRALMRHSRASTTMECYIAPCKDREREAQFALNETLDALLNTPTPITI